MTETSTPAEREESKYILKKSDKFTNWVLNRTTHRYMFPTLIVLLIFLIICLTAKTYYLFLDTGHYYVDHTLDPNPYITHGIDKYIRELDIAGLLGGVIGIFISLYITGVIEEGNALKERENELKAAENIIRQEETQQTVSTITDVVNKIWEKDRNFKPVDNVSDVVKSISGILNIAKAKGSMIYVMNHSASFGYLLGFKVHTILDYDNISIENLKTLKYSDYFRMYDEYESDRKRNLKIIQDEAGRKIFLTLNERPLYVTLNPNSVEGTIPYVDNYLKEIIKENSVQIVFYSKYDTDNTIKEVQNIQELKEIDNLYLVNVELLPDAKVSEATSVIDGVKTYDADKLKQPLLDLLVEAQKIDIKELEAAKYKVKLVNSIYYQVYLNELSLPSEEGACLFMFVNHQTIWKSGRKLLAFESRKEKYVSDSFISIITSTE